MKTKKARKFKVGRKDATSIIGTNSILLLRNRVVWKQVATSINTYLKGDKIGTCFVCAGTFEKHCRDHSFCSSACYREWSRGQIRPRNLD